MSTPDDVDEYALPYSTCEGDGSALTPEGDGTGAQCLTCGIWNIDFCPDCGDEFDAPCTAHLKTEHY